MSLEIVLLLLSAFITSSTLTQNAWGSWGGMVAALPTGLGVATAAFLLVFFYLALEAFPARWWRRLAQLLGMVFIFGQIILGFAGHQIALRNSTPSPSYRNDGIVQSVAAARLLLGGTNPYTADFGTTELRTFPSPKGADERNPAFDHYAYPPATFLVFVPLVLLQDVTGWPIDYQSLELVFFAAIVGLLLWIARGWSLRQRILILTLGNPFLWVYAVAGFNDFLFLFCLLAAVLSVDRKRYVVAGVLLGLALASKQTVWLLLPLWGYWAWRLRANDPRGASRFAIATILTGSALLLPFLVASPSGMYDDLVRYASGSIPNTYPIAGTTLAPYLAVLAGVRNAWEPLRLWPVQLAVYIPLLGMLLYKLRKRFTLDRFLASQAVLILAVVLVNRFGALNYFVPVIILALAAYLYRERDLRTGVAVGAVPSGSRRTPPAESGATLP